MARDPKDLFIDSTYFGRFVGLRNTTPDHALAQARTTAGPDDPVELERAINIDIDDNFKVRRRRGFTQVASGEYHSLWAGATRTFVVKDGVLGTLNHDFSFNALLGGVGPTKLAYVDLGPITYFAGETISGKVLEDNTVTDWGTAGEGEWYSPVLRPTEYAGEIQGRQFTAPPNARYLVESNGRIFLAVDNVLWATEYLMPDYVDRTRNFFQFESDITGLGTCSTGIVVGTERGTYLVFGPRFTELRRRSMDQHKCIHGTMVQIDPKVMGDEARSSEGVMYMTDHGVRAVVGDGVGYNVTEERVILPDAESGAAMFRQQDGINQYVSVTDTGGTPTSKARIGDYVDAEIRRFQGG